MIVLNNEVDDIQKCAGEIPTDDGVPGLLVALGVDDLQERIEERLRRLGESDSAMFCEVTACLGFVPDERDAVELEANIHVKEFPQLYGRRQYAPSQGLAIRGTCRRDLTAIGMTVLPGKTVAGRRYLHELALGSAEDALRSRIAAAAGDSCLT